MSGNKVGGRKAADTNLRRYGKNFYRIIGQRGGKIGTSGGFGSKFIGRDGLTGAQRARVAGTEGGRNSRRPKPIHIH